jgi:carbonic anhydrase
MSAAPRADWPEYPESDEDMFAGARSLARQFALVLPVVLCVGTPFAVAGDAAGDDPAMTAGEALSRLKSGNDRFSHDAALGQAVDSARRAVLAKGQSPFAMVLSCADSRVPPEVVFNVGLGDLFVVRAAGEVTDRSILASLEYGAEHLHTPLLVVLGHESCGAVKAASEAAAAGKHAASHGPNLDYLLHAIEPAVARAARTPEEARLAAAIKANVDLVIDDMLRSSATLRTLVHDHKLQLVGAYYELASGKVLFSDTPHEVTDAQLKRARVKLAARTASARKH